LIFADPPYVKTPDAPDILQVLLGDTRLPGLLQSDGLMVLERNANAPPLNLGQWHLVRQKRYGGTEIIYVAHPQ
jgi:16S rRNA G966 N2-methylase RsmD